MRTLGALWKILRGLWHLFMGLWTIRMRFPRLSVEQREMRVQAWALQLLALWGIHLKVIGQPVSAGPALLVSNHISWADILVLHAARYCRFVSKADVHHWPLIGRLATGAGTLYIERASRRDALRVVHQMAAALEAGDVLPENINIADLVDSLGTGIAGVNYLRNGNFAEPLWTRGSTAIGCPVGLRTYRADGLSPTLAAQAAGVTRKTIYEWTKEEA